MSAPGHCKHCGPSCEARGGWHSSAGLSIVSGTVAWLEGGCPRCAEVKQARAEERAQIDADILAHLRARKHGNDLIAEGIGQALDIVRGDPPGHPSQQAGEA